MLKILTFLLNVLPLVLSWLYLAVAIFAVVLHLKRIKKREKMPIGQWVFFVLSLIYCLVFAVTFVFFIAVWKMLFSVLGLMSLVITTCWSRYDDMRHGRRWWRW